MPGLVIAMPRMHGLILAVFKAGDGPNEEQLEQRLSLALLRRTARKTGLTGHHFATEGIWVGLGSGKTALPGRRGLGLGLDMWLGLGLGSGEASPDVRVRSPANAPPRGHQGSEGVTRG